MPLSEHEQRMLDQIESALYAEDPKFASTVRGKRMGMASNRRRLQAGALFVLGLTLLIAGVALPVKPGGFPIISLLGFLVMFGAGVLVLVDGRRRSTSVPHPAERIPERVVSPPLGVGRSLRTASRTGWRNGSDVASNKSDLMRA